MDNKKTDSNFGKRLSIAISNANLNRQSFSKAMGVSERTVDSWCYNERTPDMKKLLKMIEILQINSDWLLFGDDEKIFGGNI